MTNKPFFSVIIPTFNRAKFIRQTIESVLVQPFLDYEIIVVDDGSTDNTDEIVLAIQDNRIHYFKKENAERAAARNFGAIKANGTYVNFLDSDDLIYTNHLPVARKFCNENENVEIFHLGFDIKNEQGVVLRSANSLHSINSQILSGNILSCNGVFVRRDIMLMNPFNEDRALSSLEDWELWVRMSAQFNFLHNNTITSTVVQHDDRSVMNQDLSKIRLKVERFIFHVQQNDQNVKRFGRGLKKVSASAYTYAALHLAIGGASRKEILDYLLKGISDYPGEMLKKRFLVIAKKLLGY